jgi:ribonucleotide reductase alpha subunit
MRKDKVMKFNAEQVTEYLNMEASYRKMSAAFEKVTPDIYTEEEYAEICRRYAYATIQMVKLRSFVRGPKV